MTIVVGQKFGSRIIILSDTMISDGETAKPLVIPGRLKALVLSEDISVAYAGHANQCHDVAITCYDMVRSGASVADMVEFLRNQTADQGDNVLKEFLVAAHTPNAELYVIKDGRVGNGAGPYFLGEAAVFDRMMGDEYDDQLQGIDFNAMDFGDGEFGTASEMIFKSRFGNLFGDGPLVADGVGGIPIDLLASPYGHTYEPRSVSMAWNKLVSSNPIFASALADQERRAATGETEWRYQTVTPGTRGVPVLGLYLDQLRIGFLYLPAISETPYLLQGVDNETFAETVEWKARETAIDARLHN